MSPNLKVLYGLVTSMAHALSMHRVPMGVYFADTGNASGLEVWIPGRISARFLSGRR
jgi:hypothetical protein